MLAVLIFAEMVVDGVRESRIGAVTVAIVAAAATATTDLRIVRKGSPPSTGTSVPTRRVGPREAAVTDTSNEVRGKTGW